MRLSKLKTHICFALAKLPMKGQLRRKFYDWGGDFAGNRGFVGTSCIFDTMYPQNINIGKGVHITANVTILTHYLDTSKEGIHWRSGHVFIGDRAFIGTGTIISKDVRIGNNVIIGAGSVVTKDVPDNEIWAGNPARMIKKR